MTYKKANARGFLKRVSKASLYGLLVMPMILAPLAKAQDRAVYYDAKYTTGWLQEAQSQTLRNYFTSQGYQLLDAAGLKTFMEAHVKSGAPSVVIMARDQAPDTVVDVSSGGVVDTGNLIVEYMSASGRIVHVGDWPFYNIALSTGKTLDPAPAGNGATTILGIPGSDTSTGCTNDSQKPVVFTDEGKKEGLTVAWNSQRVIPDVDADVILAESAEGSTVDGGCAAGWIKKFPDSTGKGEFIRLYDVSMNFALDSAQLTQIKSVAEYGLGISTQDTVAPSAITDLAVSSTTNNSATLSFTSPADTGTGSAGNAAGYEIRYSFIPITNANFAKATLTLGGTPSKAGTKESVTVSGLDTIQQYYFAIIAHDLAGNSSALSNVAKGATVSAALNLPVFPTVKDKVVYYDDNYPTNWIARSAAQATRDYFVALGYTLVDASGLADFMTKHISSKAASSVVMANDIFPDTVVETVDSTVSDQNTVNDYMKNNGRVIFGGDWPFYNIGRADGTETQLAGNGAISILGFNASGGTQDTKDNVILTQEALALGMSSSWTAQRPALVGDVDTVLDTCKGGAAGWIKFYPDKTSSGGFYRLLDTGGITDAVRADMQKLAEAQGTYVAQLGRINGTVSDASGNPIAEAVLSFTSTSNSFTASTDANGYFSLLAKPGVYAVSGKANVSGITAVVSSAGSVTASASQLSEVTGIAVPVKLPSMPKPTDKAVYYDAGMSFGWIGATNGQAINDYFVGKGYQALDAASVETFMTSHAKSKTPSVVVMSSDIYPDTIVDASTSAPKKSNIINDYMNNGGRVIHVSDWPFYNVSSSSGSNVNFAGNGAITILGFDAAGGTGDINDTVVPTVVGAAMGLKSAWKSARPAQVAAIDVELDSAQGGAAAWFKLYPDTTGTGAFVRMYDTGSADALSDDTLADLQTVAEFSGYFKGTEPSATTVKLGDLNGDGKINVSDATISLRIAVGLVTPTADQKTADDVNKDGKTTVADTTLILQVAVGVKTGF